MLAFILSSFLLCPRLFKCNSWCIEVPSISLSHILHSTFVITGFFGHLSKP